MGFPPAPGRFIDDYDDSFWDFDVDGDGDIDASDFKAHGR